MAPFHVEIGLSISHTEIINCEMFWCKTGEYGTLVPYHYMLSACKIYVIYVQTSET